LKWSSPAQDQLIGHFRIRSTQIHSGFTNSGPIGKDMFSNDRSTVSDTIRHLLHGPGADV